MTPLCESCGFRPPHHADQCISRMRAKPAEPPPEPIDPDALIATFEHRTRIWLGFVILGYAAGAISAVALMLAMACT